MKSIRHAITAHQYKHLYAPDGAMRTIVDRLLRELPDADYILIEAVKVDDFPADIVEVDKPHTEADVRDSLCSPGLSRNEEMSPEHGETP